MRCAIYARFSSDLQREESIEDQVRICRARADREGWTVVDLFSDAAISGSTLLRPGLQALLHALRAGRIDIVLAESLDRISRDQEHIAAFYKQVTFVRARIVTLAEGDINEFHVGVNGAVGASYLKELALRTSRGMQGRILAGRSLGTAPYGYRVVRQVSSTGDLERGLREIVPEEAAVVRRIFESFAGGLSPLRIAKMLNQEGTPGPSGGVWYDVSIRGRPAHNDGLLRNPTYIGLLTWGRRTRAKDPATGVIVRHSNEPDDAVSRTAPELRIVEQSLWDRVQAQLAAGRVPSRGSAPAQAGEDRFWDRRRPRHLLSGKVLCGCCGRPFAALGKDELGCPAGRTGGCRNSKRVRRSELEAQVLTALSRQLMQPDALREFIRTFNAEWKRLGAELANTAEAGRRELATLSRKIANLVEAISDGDRSPSLRAKLAELEARRDRLAAETTAAPAQLPTLHPAIGEVYRAKVAGLRDALGRGDDREAFEAARALIDHVIVSPPEDDGDPPRIELVGHLVEVLRAGVAAGAAQDGLKAAGPVLNAFTSSVKAGQGASRPLVPEARYA